MGDISFQRETLAVVRTLLEVNGTPRKWATNAILAGVPLKVVSEQPGHSSISVTADIYQHVTTDLAAEAAERIADLYSR